jgi:hypothetical protein
MLSRLTWRRGRSLRTAAFIALRITLSNASSRMDFLLRLRQMRQIKPLTVSNLDIQAQIKPVPRRLNPFPDREAERSALRSATASLWKPDAEFARRDRTVKNARRRGSYRKWLETVLLHRLERHARDCARNVRPSRAATNDPHLNPLPEKRARVLRKSSPGGGDGG